MDNHPWYPQSSGRGRITHLNRCAADWGGRGNRTYPLFCRCHHYSSPRARLLVRFGARVPPARRGRVGIANGLAVSSKKCVKQNIAAKTVVAALDRAEPARRQNAVATTLDQAKLASLSEKRPKFKDVTASLCRGAASGPFRAGCAR